MQRMTTLWKTHYSLIIGFGYVRVCLCVPVHIVTLFFYACFFGKSLQILSKPPTAAAAAAPRRLALRAPNSLSATLSSSSSSYYSCPGARFRHTKPREGGNILGLSHLIPPLRAGRLPGGYASQITVALLSNQADRAGDLAEWWRRRCLPGGSA